MKKYSIFLIVLILGCATQKPVTVVPTNFDISDNLDLEAVASIFGNSRDLVDFERTLNDPKFKISNLDLDNDGYVDYLRVVEMMDRGAHLVTIQAVLGNDLFQDVATIDIERDQFNKPSIQFIGHPYFYGPHYIIEPVYYRTPFIYDTFWGPNYAVYYSPYYYNYYPSYFNYWRPIPVRQYVKNVYVYRNEKNTYKYVPERRNQNAPAVIRDTRRNDYVNKNPEQSFTTRNKEVANKQALETRRSTVNSNTRETNTTPRRDTRETENTNRTRPTEGTNTSDRPSRTTPSSRTPSNTETPRTSPSNRTPSSPNTPSTSPTRRTPSSSEAPNTTPSSRKSSGETSERKNSRSDRN
jgi:hypothetical protein